MRICRITWIAITISVGGQTLEGQVVDGTARLVFHGLKPGARPVVVRYAGVWYREDRDTQAVVAGSRDRPTERRERWTLALVDDPEVPWRLVAA